MIKYTKKYRKGSGNRGLFVMIAKKFLSLIMIICAVFVGSAFAEDGDDPNTPITPQTYDQDDPRHGLPLFGTDNTNTDSLGRQKNTKPATTSYVAGAYNALLRRKIETEIIITNLRKGDETVPAAADIPHQNNKFVPGNVVSQIDIGEDNSLKVTYSQVEIPLDDGVNGQLSQQYIPIWVE